MPSGADLNFVQSLLYLPLNNVNIYHLNLNRSHRMCFAVDLAIGGSSSFYSQLQELSGILRVFVCQALCDRFCASAFVRL